MVVALLGVLKCGAAYVPLDAGYPEERLRFMARDAEVALVLTSPETEELFSAEGGLDVRAALEAAEGTGAANPAPRGRTSLRRRSTPRPSRRGPRCCTAARS